MVMDYQSQLESAKAIIKSLQEELRSAKRQIELLNKKNKELENLCITDELTGLYNWRHFRNRLEQEVARNKRQRHPLCLIFFDIDNLKAYNDTYGHSGGNSVLKAVAQCLLRNIRKDVDSGYRYGGDEFAVLLPETKAEQAFEIAKRISRGLKESGLENVSVSFGIAELTPEIDSQTLFKRADSAMYVAKRRPGDKIYIFSQSNAEE